MAGPPTADGPFATARAAVAGDKFKLGELLDTGALLLGRATWQLFAGIWPARDDAFSSKMNDIPKLVASRSLQRVDGMAELQPCSRATSWTRWCRRKADQDLVVAGSAGVVHTLMEHDLVDEYRLLVFPIVLGQGSRLFERGAAHRSTCAWCSAEPAGAAVLVGLQSSDSLMQLRTADLRGARRV